MRKNNLAYICSPYRGNIIEQFRNIRYARYITKIALDLGYTPITTHLYLTQVLDDKVPMQRRRGLRAGNRGHEIKNHFKGRMYKNQRGAGTHRQTY